ncbi:O-antigen polysaccharide polymerase Wzy [Microbacterium sp. Leaf347]|uniref:O-antigen polysaccharide polymerase Wzy n=2 Tax=unclassified Microbacterium TaxID=2609290 RepID=UPI00138ED123|nr:O-antigen polysaccharide polymerase Wzy [Microbacterium sp. Leaf347]
MPALADVSAMARQRLWLLGSGLMVLVAILVPHIATWSTRPRAYTLLATIAFVCVVETRRARDILSPLNLLSAIFAFLYVAKANYILDTGFTSPAATADGQIVSAAIESELAGVMTLVGVAYWCLVMGFWLFARPVANRLPLNLTRSASVNSTRWAWWTVLSMGLALGGYGWLIVRAGGIIAYIDGLALRSSSLEGVSFVTLSGVPLLVLTFYGVAHWLSGQHTPTSMRVLTIIAIVIALTTATLSGGRAAIITGTLLPLMLLIHYLRRPFGLGGVLAAGAAGFALLLTLGALLRDRTFAAPGADAWSFVVARFNDVTASTLGGVEAVPLDTLLVTYREISSGSTPLQLGQTYEPIFTWLIPRAVWPDKPAGGGNAWFTSEFVPRFYGPNQVETSISAIGESFANFGWIGVLVVFFILGIVLTRLYSRLRTTIVSIDGIVVYALMASYFFPVIRGDAYHNVTSVVFMLAVWAAIRFLVVARMAPPEGSARGLQGRVRAVQRG